MELQEQISVCYQHFYIKFRGAPSFLFVPNDSQVKSINKLIKWFDSYYGKNTTGVNKLFDFFAYQFYYYSKPGALKSRSYLQLGHVVGDKAIERWVSKNSFELEAASAWASDKGIFMSEINDVINYEENPVSLNFLEETERKRFFNTQYGLSNCLSLTQGYWAKSEYCKLCKFSIDCRKMTNNG